MYEQIGDSNVMSQKTVTINGTVYDAHTGLPISSAKTNDSVTPKQPSHSQSVHTTTQKSQTLNRRVVKNSAPKHALSKQQVHSGIKKSPMVTKFAPHPVGVAPTTPVADVAPVHHHPIAAKAKHIQAVQAHHATQPRAPKPAQIIKQEAIANALDRAPKHSKGAEQIRQPRRFSRFMSVGSAGIALLLLGGYFTYLNMPNLSVRVAAAQAGVNASYPEYRPDGYSLSGAVAYDQGEVNMKFASNSGPQNFTISQKKSSWDSSAVLDNYVKEKAGENYITYNERGLTIYTYGSNAAWVNDGVLYTIDGDAPLSSDQIRQIATSM